MKINNNLILCLLILPLLLSAACKKSGGGNTPAPPSNPPVVDPPDAPIKAWQEHWFEHKQLVSRVYYDTVLAVYYDNDVSRTITWPYTFLKDVWLYSNATYGKLYGTDKRLYAIFHTGKYGGGHPAYYYDAGHDNKNVIDCGSNAGNAWISGTGNDLDLATHEIGHIVESTTHGTKSSPAFTLWKDSKWMEIYIYDVYKGLKREADAARWFNMMMTTTDNFPAPNTQWFKNWFFPIYDKHGGSAVLSKFFKLLADHFPKNGDGRYTRDLNWGEFIHFWSGAAGTSLKAQATIAFGWPAEWEVQFNNAKTAFPGVTY
ncbi:hypothetical protein HB364_07010 [Pseudoflavitalea sp. X16]|uniref:hypothetical protein n=1 Tax=Paraflavitalea devenefica TaxID=2716334 RepID=UPI00142486B9|nr:hypothetical protein [Paraflavitalea devenefica]NII24820.1 hypothetical protein [Paraflavitalea devenefica]